MGGEAMTEMIDMTALTVAGDRIRELEMKLKESEATRERMESEWRQLADEQSATIEKLDGRCVSCMQVNGQHASTCQEARAMRCDHCKAVLGSKFYSDVPLWGDLCHDCHETTINPKRPGHQVATEFLKNDGDKSRPELIPEGFIMMVGEVFAYGVRKYKIDNWQLCEDKRRYIGAALRHILQYAAGEVYDRKEDGGSGLEHLGHAAASIAMLWGIAEGKSNE